MFKSILPSRKLSDTDFLMVTAQADSHKENYPASPMNTTRAKLKKSKDKDSPVAMDLVQTEEAFDQLLNELQVPEVLRPKLARIESGVKAAMLKSSQTISKGSPPLQPPQAPHTLRKSQSAQSISTMTTPLLPEHAQPTSPKSTTRGKSVDVPRTPKPEQQKTAKEKGKKDKGRETAVSPRRYCNLLQSASSLQLDIEVVKKLRLMLRNESASWTEEFVWTGGYNALLLRLQEILDVEWREEQHDDQILHELLRCVKALSTSAIGCVALRSCCPTPFQPLITLLYSDKRPGEVGTKQLIVGLLLILFDLYPPSSLPSTGGVPTNTNGTTRTHGRSLSVPWEVMPGPSSLVTLPAPHATTFSLVRSLLLTPAPPPAEDPRVPISPHPFIEELHTPRIYKTYLQELNDICRDYFWVFCHPNNTIWNLDETDEDKVEKPRAPGGMTGGVEFEAMSYMTLHFKFVNAVAASAEQVNVPREHELSAYRLHCDLFLSGIDRVILVARKASTTYYPTLHLEIARYIAAATRSGYEIPYSVFRIVGLPPQAMCKPASRAQTAREGSARRLPLPHRRSQSVASSPQLPVPRRVTPMFNS
ncbi:uncharacterized protein PHACADRAFT_117477 [Phanerochaete carnosa HHB-10118-sp]|uniref:Formin GTPase-binding domain-containing protein n=1 Tax=Phanerochaete carnosa (strain HHB-10118-sp) TaxID=650164 RepID=K5WHA0_PHACS|nr:uncharacterized protein PHACADRAFT_117477 [Phanerochaete carnosa HHB-10118-sp]EKM58484.1 hypothetical protein PHACADRAFT_117477 [Phanerochaete carnosa HHB-10118-sp]